MIKISVKADVERLKRELDDFARKQLPFATARALTEVAKKAQKAATAALPSVLDRPTPFTMRAYGVKAASKSNLTAAVFAKPVQASYLAPEEFGAPQKVAKIALLDPVDVRLNTYGNIPRGALAKYKGRQDVFVARLTMKSGHVIAGVWQRLAPPTKRATIGRYKNIAARPAQPGRLRLLFEFEYPKIPRVRLGFRDLARKVIEAEIGPELRRQLEIAMRTAR